MHACILIDKQEVTQCLTLHTFPNPTRCGLWQAQVGLNMYCLSFSSTQNTIQKPTSKRVWTMLNHTYRMSYSYIPWKRSIAIVRLSSTDTEQIVSSEWRESIVVSFRFDICRSSTPDCLFGSTDKSDLHTHWLTQVKLKGSLLLHLSSCSDHSTS